MFTLFDVNPVTNEHPLQIVISSEEVVRKGVATLLLRFADVTTNEMTLKATIDAVKIRPARRDVREEVGHEESTLGTW